MLTLHDGAHVCFLQPAGRIKADGSADGGRAAAAAEAWLPEVSSRTSSLRVGQLQLEGAMPVHFQDVDGVCTPHTLLAHDQTFTPICIPSTNVKYKLSNEVVCDCCILLLQQTLACVLLLFGLLHSFNVETHEFAGTDLGRAAAFAAMSPDMAIGVQAGERLFHHFCAACHLKWVCCQAWMLRLAPQAAPCCQNVLFGFRVRPVPSPCAMLLRLFCGFSVVFLFVCMLSVQTSSEPGPGAS